MRQTQRGGVRKKIFHITFILSGYFVDEKHKCAVTAEVKILTMVLISICTIQ